MWTYRITDGVMTSAAGELVFRGYSGAGHTAAEGRNNPAMQAVPNHGPIPAGRYRIGAPRDSSNTGPLTLDLTPYADTRTYGRDLFRIHGNNARDDASHGCIILPPDARRCIADSGDRELEVVA